MTESMPAQPLSEGDYETVFAALSGSGKGRAFLSEYLRRSRPAETRALYDALRRIESNIGSVAEARGADRIAADLRRIAADLDGLSVGDPSPRYCGTVAARAGRELMLLADTLSPLPKSAQDDEAADEVPEEESR